MVNFQKSPSLGINEAPQFTWIVPPCAGAGDDHNHERERDQDQIKVMDAVTGKVLWDSGTSSTKTALFARMQVS